ncbi:MAG: glycosyltransferase family 4 protein [Microthrixaceae bacterium]|nr:glycosyltransferase family 4 protein [Microthrixaceae bacterium]
MPSDAEPRLASPGSSTEIRAIHLGEVAGVARTLVDGLNSVGFRAVQRQLPAPAPDSNLVAKALTSAPRIASAKRIRSELKHTGAIAHVHYATSGLWFLGCHPLVVHCHGTDVRSPGSLQQRILNRVFAGADLIIAATPDLISRLPDGACYLPNPVDTERFAPDASGSVSSRDVLVFAALTDIKGAPEILRIVTQLKRARPELSITAIDHGSYADDFRAAGVEMIGFMDASELPGLISDHRIVIGQRKLGVAGTSELQAMAMGKPVVMPLDDSIDPMAQPPVITDADPDRVAEWILDLLDNDEELQRLGVVAREWTVENHGVVSVTRRLIDLYGTLV